MNTEKDRHSEEDKSFNNIEFENPGNEQDCNSHMRIIKQKLQEAENSLHKSITKQIANKIEGAMLSGERKKCAMHCNLQEAQETKIMFFKLNKVQKLTAEYGIHVIKIPINKPDQPKQAKQWKTIDNPEDITKYIIQQNHSHFRQAKDIPFNLPQLSSEINFKAATATSDLILEGDYSPEELNDIS